MLCAFLSTSGNTVLWGVPAALRVRRSTRSTELYWLNNPALPPPMMDPKEKHRIQVFLSKDIGTRFFKYADPPRMPILPVAGDKGFAGSDIALVIAGQPFRAGISQNNNWKHGLEPPCNIQYADDQRNATLSIVKNVILPLEAAGAKVTVFFATPTCTFCIPSCRTDWDRAQRLSDMLEGWLRESTPEQGRKLVSKPIVEGQCEGIDAMLYLWLRWVQEMRGGREFDYMFQIRHDLAPPLPITEWVANFSKLNYQGLSTGCTAKCSMLDARDPIRIKTCMRCNRDLFFWVPARHAAAYRRGHIGLSFCGHLTMHGVRGQVDPSEIGFLLPACDEGNNGWKHFDKFCPEELMYRPRRHKEPPTNDLENKQPPTNDGNEPEESKHRPRRNTDPPANDVKNKEPPTNDGNEPGGD